MSRRKILFNLSGSIAAYKACALISKLVQEGFEVQAACTPSAFQFIGAATLEGLTGKPVLSDTFAKGHAMDHISLARDSDLTILCPATASTLNRLAAGLGDDLVGTLFLAHGFGERAGAPYWIVPAMNPEMYLHPATQQSLEKLRAWGVRIIEPAEGRMACGESGPGRMPEPEELLSEIRRYFAESSSTSARPQGRRILVTAGATREPIDAVRFVTNFSTGATGAAIADELSAAGHDVVYLHGRGAAQPESACESVEFSSVADLGRTLDSILHERRFDGVVHAAAVSDFTVDRIESDGLPAAEASGELPKLPSDGPVRLLMKPAPKLIDRIRSASRNSELRMVAFKLTHGAAEGPAVAKLIDHSRADWVVHNHLSEVGANTHSATLYDSRGRAVARTETKRELERTLARLFSGEMNISSEIDTQEMKP